MFPESQAMQPGHRPPGLRLSTSGRVSCSADSLPQCKQTLRYLGALLIESLLLNTFLQYNLTGEVALHFF